MLQRDENLIDDMIDVLEFLDQYIPESVKVLLGGDQLTCERVRGAQKARLQACGKKKLQQFIAKIEDWHALQAYYQVIWEELYSTSSVRDKGSLYQLRILIDRRNVVSDPKKDLHACQSFLHTVLEATILAVFASQHSSETFDIALDSIFPTGMPESPESKICCLTSLASAIVDNLHIDALSVPCSDCDDSANYTYKLLGVGRFGIGLGRCSEGRWQENHPSMEVSVTSVQTSWQDEVCLRSFILSYNLNVSLTAKQSSQLMHNRTCNVKGRKGENKSLDLQMEHMNRLFKDDISTFSPHLSMSKSTVMKVSRASSTVQKFMEKFDNDMAVRPDSGRHTTPSQDTDRHTIFRELIANKTCVAYSHFQHISRDIFAKLHKADNWAAYIKWLQDKI